MLECCRCSCSWPKKAGRPPSASLKRTYLFCVFGNGMSVFLRSRSGGWARHPRRRRDRRRAERRPSGRRRIGRHGVSGKALRVRLRRIQQLQPSHHSRRGRSNFFDAAVVVVGACSSFRFRQLGGRFSRTLASVLLLCFIGFTTIFCCLLPCWDVLYAPLFFFVFSTFRRVFLSYGVTVLGTSTWHSTVPILPRRASNLIHSKSTAIACSTSRRGEDTACGGWVDLRVSCACLKSATTRTCCSS